MDEAQDWAAMGSRQQDMFITEKLFGKRSTYWGDDLVVTLDGDLPGDVVPHYTTSMDDAWKLVEHIRGRFDVHVGSAPLQYDVAVLDRRSLGHFKASAASAPEAICLAILRASGVNI